MLCSQNPYLTDAALFRAASAIVFGAWAMAGPGEFAVVADGYWCATLGLQGHCSMCFHEVQGNFSRGPSDPFAKSMASK